MGKQLISLIVLSLMALSFAPQVFGQSLALPLVDRIGLNGVNKVEESSQIHSAINDSIKINGSSTFFYDVNRDGKVSIRDVVAVIGYLLYGSPQETHEISSAYYYIGTSNGWAPFDATYKLDNGGGNVNDNPVFSVVIPTNGKDNWFKIYPQETMEVAEGNFWFSNFIGYYRIGANGMSGSFVEGINDEAAFWFRIPANTTANRYRLSFDMENCTFEFEAIEAMDAADTLRAEQLFKKCYDYVYGYGDMQIVDGTFVDYVRQVWNANNLTTDEALCAWGDQGIPEFSFNYYDASHPFLANLYHLLYTSIGICNDYLNTFVYYDATKSAEVRFIRALDYFYLLDFWGNVPLATSPDLTDSQQVSRVELFLWLEKELLKLREDLSEPKALKEGDIGYGRVDRDAANLLLARLYLNAQVYCGGARWTDAARYAKMVMDGPHKLNTEGVANYTPYQMLFMGDNGQTSAAIEAIFPIPLDGGRTESWGSSMFLIASTYDQDMHPNQNDITAVNGLYTYPSWGGSRARPELVRLFFPNDDAPRGHAYTVSSAAHDDRALFETTYRILENTDPSNFKDGYAVAKYNNFKTDGSQGSDPTFPDADFFFMRSAEAYLTYAEALTRQAGGFVPSQAVSAINAIRARSHATQHSSYSLNQILDEWSREFYFEGRRRMDLIRFNRYGGNTDYVWSWKGGVLAGRNFDAFRNVFAIPEADMAVNTNLVQNPGYESIPTQPTMIVLNPPVETVVDLSESNVINFEWQEPYYNGWPPLKYRLEVSTTNEWMISTDEADADSSGATMPDYAALPSSYTSCNAVVTAAELDRALEQICRWSEDNVPETLTVYVRCATTTRYKTVYSNVVALVVKPFYMGITIAPVELWYLVGEGIGSVDWDNSANSVATGGLIPMYPVEGNEYDPYTGRGEICYAGYFYRNKGFRLIKTPGSWDDQWGMHDGYFVKNIYDCDKITVDADGYYLIRLNTALDELVIEPYNYHVSVFSMISMPGEYQEWDTYANPMNAMSTSVENHDWYLMNVTFGDTQLKFAANNCWDVNWGSNAFPYGTGFQEGPIIPVEAGTYHVFFNDILGSYNFIRQE